MSSPSKRIAIIGSGISGLTCAHQLTPYFDVTLFEKNEYFGGHTQTHDVALGDEHFPVDTGFIVFNDRTYPRFMSLLSELGCDYQKTEMSFSLRRDRLEYNGHNLNTLFAQRRNLVNPSFLWMVKDILKFNRIAKRVDPADARPLSEFFHSAELGRAFQSDYLLPMAAAIWSTGDEDINDFPVGMLTQFFLHHGLLDLKNRPTWFVVKGGSSSYVTRVLSSLADARSGVTVESVKRTADHVEVSFNGVRETFDEVIFACHSNEALALLSDPSDDERATLSRMPYGSNRVVMHTDARLMPREKRAWASWNYHGGLRSDRPQLTYWMNLLEGLETETPILVTLNADDEIAPAKVLTSVTYHHPVFDAAFVAAQRRWSDISGRGRTHYCGAYWRYGFHEDGVWSAERVVGALKDRALAA